MLTFLCFQGLKENSRQGGEKKQNKKKKKACRARGKEMQEPAVPAAAKLAVALTRWIAFYVPVPPQPWEMELLLSVASALQMLSQK